MKRSGPLILQRATCEGERAEVSEATERILPLSIGQHKGIADICGGELEGVWGWAVKAGVLHVVRSSVTPKMCLKKGGGVSLIGANPVTGGRLCQLKPHGPRPK